MQAKTLNLKNSGGFTLIELLVVIVVIGILIALAVPNFFAYQQRGRDTARKADLGQISSALEEHYGDRSFYPETLGTDFVSSYLRTDELPQDPQGGDYTYTPLDCNVDNECQGYELSADLENENDRDANEDGEYVIESINRPNLEEA